MKSSSQFEPASLFLLDSLANLIDFAFHFWMGRILIPTDFAILQTLNSIALVYVTASGVFQPVVGRFIAEARGRGEEGTIPAIIQTFFRAALILGIIFSILVFTLSTAISPLLNLPRWTIQISAVLVLLSTLRPVAAGALQGKERFLAFGFARLALSLGRILLVILLIPAGITLPGAIIALPFGWLVSVACAFFFMGNLLWKRSEPLRKNILQEGWKLSVYALLAFSAYMSLTSIDLIWIHRTLDGDSAGAYASLALMRRILALLPGVAVTVMFPRIVQILAQGRNPNHLLGRTALLILAAGGALTILYFLLANPLLSILFGNQYQAAASLLGPMGIAMTGVSLSSIWLNYYLAERPRNFVILLIAAVALEWILLYSLPASLSNATLAFGLTGWSLTFEGLILYVWNFPRQAISPSH